MSTQKPLVHGRPHDRLTQFRVQVAPIEYHQHLGQCVLAHTKSEARSVMARHLKLPRLPQGLVLVKAR